MVGDQLELFGFAIVVAVEPIEVSPPHGSSLWRADAEIGKRNPRLDRPAPVAIARVLNRTVHLSRRGSCSSPCKTSLR